MVGAVGIIPVRVPEIVPFRVPEIVPDRVPEIVPLLVPDIVPAKAGVETARANIDAHTMDLAFFIVLLLMFQTSWVIGRLNIRFAEPTLGRLSTSNWFRIHAFQGVCHNLRPEIRPC